MATLYQRNFKAGRSSEQLYNEELHKMYESIRHLLDIPENKALAPTAKLDGSIWLNRKDNTLKTYQKSTGKWKNIFDNKFQIIDNITSQYPPQNPIKGQLWIYEGAMFWYNGTEWVPIKSQISDGLELDLSLFKNFLFISQLNEQGSSVMDSNVIKEYNEKIKLYKEGKLDLENDDFFKAFREWQIGDYYVGDEFSPTEMLGLNLQYLVPDTHNVRVFLDGKLDTTYNEISRVCIQYPGDYIKKKEKSGFIHINPGHLKNIEKTLVKVDRITGKLEFNSVNFELYGFNSNSPFGTLLFPEKKQDDGGYIKTEDGAILSYQQTQAYDYILIVTYDFSWLKMTGKLNKGNSEINKSTYYIPNYKIPMNIFVNGYNLEETSYTKHNLSKTITINENTYNYSVNGFETAFREFGFIRQIDINNNAVIRVSKRYKRPLILMNGEAVDVISPDSRIGLNGVSYDSTRGIIKVPNGKLNMVWAVAELHGDTQDPDFDMFVQNGDAIDNNEIDKLTATGVPVVPPQKINRKVITFDINEVNKDDKLSLFVNGLYLDPTELEIDYTNGKIYFEGEKEEVYDYILIKDRFDRLLNNREPFKNAIAIGKFNETMVYINGSLVMNHAPLIDFRNPDDIETPLYNQIKFFVSNEVRDPVTNEVTTLGEYYIYKKQLADDGTDISEWIKLDDVEKGIIEKISNSYINMSDAISITLDSSLHDSQKDLIDVYGYKYATYEGYPIQIGNIEITKDQLEHPDLYPNANTTDFKNFDIEESFTPGYNLLSVYVNGLMQYDIIEHADGSGFTFPEPITEPVHISYIVESPDQFDDNYIQRIILDEHNAVAGANNVYKTYPLDIKNYEPKPSLYPGQVIVYIDGVRQPQESYTILDNYTIMFNDEERTLVGNSYNYPDEIFLDNNHIPVKDKNGNLVKIHHSKADRIMIEIRQDFNRVENYIKNNNSRTVNYSINVQANNLPAEILESNDEILIYINGLFPGLKLNDGVRYAYTRNPSKGTIDILDPDLCEIIESKGPLAKQMYMTQGAVDESRVKLALAEEKLNNAKKNFAQISNPTSADRKTLDDAQKEYDNILAEKNSAEKKAVSAKKALDKYIELYGDYNASLINLIFDWRNV